MSGLRVPRAGRRAAAVVLAAVTGAGGMLACAPDERGEAAGETSAEEAAPGADTASAQVRPERMQSELTRGDTLPGRPSWTREDLAVLEETVAWARATGVDTLRIGERIARIGERFVGSAYIPQTLDPPGPERLVVNLRAFDCVTFVESMLALAHLVSSPAAAAGESGPLMDAYSGLLTDVRYRGGELSGYPSRLHYFSEWLADNEAKGFVRIVTADLGGVRDPEPPTFMTAHREAYWQLEEPATFEAIAAVERTLSDAPRWRIPEEQVEDVADDIRSGDIIAATSTLPGLDVAHTGIALRGDDGVLRLMHAPLVGEAVQISERRLGERLLALSAQDGIMVARPLERTF